MKKIFIALIGGTVLLLGLALLLLPGPGMPVVAAGLTILATEFALAMCGGTKRKATKPSSVDLPFHSGSTCTGVWGL